MRLSLPAQLILVIIGVLFLGGLVDHQVIRACYTFSVIFKEILTLLLPAIVFSFVLGGILSFKKNAPIILILLLVAVCISNAVVAFSSYILMTNFLPFIQCSDITNDFAVASPITAFFDCKIPSVVRSEHAMIVALVLGLILSCIHIPLVERITETIKSCIIKILYNTIIPLLPLYILGFLLKIRYEGIFVQLIQQYGTTIVFLISLQTMYLILYYVIASGFSLSRALYAIQKALPSYVTAFSTMSSTATIPVSVDCAIKNTGNRPLAQMAMPIMANVHLLGDSVGVPILALTTMYIFQGCMPSVAQFLEFLFFFCTSMFAVSGIPGGGIIIMIPVLKSVLGFTPDMVSIITALYILLDSFGTAANVMADGALVIMINRILIRFNISKDSGNI